MGRQLLRPGVVTAAVCAIVALLVSGPPAHASCAGEPLPSPYAFTGTVVGTEQEDRIATVVTDSGRRVTVLGTGAADSSPGAFSSVDRRYAVGGRYEFHPTNAQSPYRDNACTATEQLAGPAPQPVEQSEDLLPAWLPVDEQAGPVGYLGFFGPALVAVGLLVAGGHRIVRRSFTTPH